MDHDTRPDPITTPEALDALPPDTVMADIDPETSAVNQVVMRVLSGEWAAPGLTQMWSSADLLAGGDERWTVLFRPDAPTPTPVTHAPDCSWLVMPAPGEEPCDGSCLAPTPAGDDQREALAQELARLNNDGHLWDADTIAALSPLPAGLAAVEERARDRYRAQSDRLLRLLAARPSAPTVTTEQRALAALTTLVALKDGPRNDTYYAERDAAWQNAREVIASRALGIEVTP